MQQAPLYAYHVTNKEHVAYKNGEFTISLDKHKHSMESGGAARCNYGKLFPTDRDLKVSYQVFLPKNLRKLKGGKLPGLSLGKEVGDNASGSDWKTDAGSCRVMFREGELGVGYLYLALPGGSAGSFRKQSGDYQKVCECKGTAGHELWGRKGGACFGLKFGDWNDVVLEVRLNTPGQTDGYFRLTVNGASKETPVAWRASEDVRWTDLNVVAFLGGSSSDWDSPADSYVKVRNVQVIATS